MAEQNEQEAQEQMEDLNIDDELSLEFGKKKKKKAKAPKEATAADENDGLFASAEGTGEGDAAAGAGAGAEPGLDVELDMDLGGKKKKKKGKKDRFAEAEDAAAAEAAAEAFDFADAAGGDEAGKKGALPWSGSDRDYTYSELLTRVFDTLRERNPELTGERRRTVLKPPQVAREGTKKTVFTNFAELCKAMNRQQEHVTQFLLAELGTSGSIDGQQRLVVKGRFQPKSFETVLRRYINEYVLCPGCKSVDTLLDKDSVQRLMHLRCQQCGASRTVSAIKTGFVARVARRQQQA